MQEAWSITCLDWASLHMHDEAAAIVLFVIQAYLRWKCKMQEGSFEDLCICHKLNLKLLPYQPGYL